MIKIYSTPTCHYCKDVKQYLTENNVAYTEIDVKEDLNARKEMIQKSGQMGVPVTEIGDKIYVGFTQELKDAVMTYPLDK